MAGSQRAFVARVSRRDHQAAHRRIVFYATLAASKEAALSAIINAVGPDDYVEMTDGRLSAETAVALGLTPGVPKVM